MKYEKIDKNKIKTRAKPQARQDFDQTKLLELGGQPSRRTIAARRRALGLHADLGRAAVARGSSQEGNHASLGRRSSTRRSPNQSSCSCGQQRIFSGRTLRTTKSS